RLRPRPWLSIWPYSFLFLRTWPALMFLVSPRFSYMLPHPSSGLYSDGPPIPPVDSCRSTICSPPSRISIDIQHVLCVFAVAFVVRPRRCPFSSYLIHT